MTPRLLFVLNDAPFFISHRLPLARAAREAGYDVHLAAPDDADAAAVLRDAGVTTHHIALDRSASSLGTEWRTFMAIRRVIATVRPDIVHNVTIKPVLYGSLARRLHGGGATVNAVPGLGYVFLSTDRRAALRRRVVETLYRVALGGQHQIAIFQNDDDAEYFLRRGLVAPERSVLIRGSGVDLNAFPAHPLPEGPPVVVLPARMLRDKGVVEFAEAAAFLRPTHPTARFALVGGLDANRAALTRAELEALTSSGAVEWWGQRTDMAAVLAAASLVVLPSYREGVPKALLEASASGRAMVTTDVPGCRHVVEHGVNGLLVPPRDARSLADAIGELLGDRARMVRMGLAARARAEAEFSVTTVMQETLAVYERVRSKGTGPGLQRRG